jgi:D-proline reductase (dithiol) PrdB
MCNQSVGLIASVIEKAGIPTTSISLLRELTQKVSPPRALYVPFPFGYPLGEPDQPALQTAIVNTALELLREPVPPPLLRDYAG